MFNLFSKVLKQQHITEEEKKKFNSFVFCRWLSGDPRTIQIANFINMNYKIPDESQLDLLKGCNIKFIKFPKYKTEKEDLSNLINNYNISYEKALDYKDILDKIMLNKE